MNFRTAAAAAGLLLVACQAKDNSVAAGEQPDPAPAASRMSPPSSPHVEPPSRPDASRTGTFAIPAVFEEAGSFAQGLAPVQLGGKWGYIEKSGRTVIQPQFGMADKFAENGLAWVVVGGKAPGFEVERISRECNIRAWRRPLSWNVKTVRESTEYLSVETGQDQGPAVLRHPRLHERQLGLVIEVEVGHGNIAKAPRAWTPPGSCGEPLLQHPGTGFLPYQGSDSRASKEVNSASNSGQT